MFGLSAHTWIFLGLVTLALGGLLPVLRAFIGGVHVERVPRVRDLRKVSGYTGEMQP